MRPAELPAAVGMTGDPTCDCRYCGCASGFHEDDGVCWNCLDDGRECPGYRPMQKAADD